MPDKSPERIKEEERFLLYRMKVLPIQLDRARRKYRALVREARRLKMNTLLNNQELHGKEFD